VKCKACSTDLGNVAGVVGSKKLIVEDDGGVWCLDCYKKNLHTLSGGDRSKAEARLAAIGKVDRPTVWNPTDAPLPKIAGWVPQGENAIPPVTE